MSISQSKPPERSAPVIHPSWFARTERSDRDSVLPRRWSVVWIILAYLGIAALATWPLIFHLSTELFSTPGDPYGAVWNLHEIARTGVPLSFPASPLLLIPSAILTRLFGDVTAYNLLILTGYVLTGIAGYGLGFRLTNQRRAAFLTGLILTLSPYHVSRSLQHLGLANIHWLIFFVSSLIDLDRSPTTQRGMVAGIWFALVILDTYLYGLFALVAAVTYLIWLIARWSSQRLILDSARSGSLWRPVRSVGLALVVGGLISLPSLWPVIAGTTEIPGLVARQVSELTTYSAQWFAYLTPLPNNPLVGLFTGSWYDASLAVSGSNLTELSLYLGLSVLGLAGIGIRSLVRRRSSPYLLFFLGLGGVGIVFSFAPTIPLLGFDLPTPSRWIYSLLPFLRVYSRFGLLTLIATAALASIGVAYVLSRLATRSERSLATGALALLIVVDLWSLPTNHLRAADRGALPTAYQQLDGGSTVYLAEYPLWGDDEPAGYEYLLWQRLHGARLLYQDLGSTARETARRALLNPADPAVIDKLAALGITHVMIHRQLYTEEQVRRHPTEFGSATPPIVTDPRLTLVGHFADGTDLYRF